MEEFLKKHELQLYSIGFPKELNEMLYMKLTSETFDTGNFFQIAKKVDEEDNFVAQEVNSLRNIHPLSCVFLVDHAWTTRLSDMRKALNSNPNLKHRVEGITKLRPKQDLPGLQVPEPTPVFTQGSVDLDEQGLSSVPSIPQNTTMLSLWGNNISSLESLEPVMQGLKALWLNDNPVSQEEEPLFEHIEENYRSIEILNSKLTTNAGIWALQFLTNCLELEGVFHLDLSDRQINRISTKILQKVNNIKSIDVSGNILTNEWLEALKKLPHLKKIKVDQNYEELLWTCIEEFQSLKYLNERDVKKGKPEDVDLILEDIWRVLGSYRLVTENEYDETSIWYLLDELGSSLTHSDVPNFALQPFLYSPSEEQSISYSLLWPIRPVSEGDTIYVNYLPNITEEQFRSYRLAVWFNIPQEPIMKQYQAFKSSLSTSPLSLADSSGNHQPNSKPHLKVATDLDFFQKSLTDSRFEISSLEQADVIWTRGQIFSDDQTHSFSDQVFINQFPYEGALVMKNQLAKTVQRNAKVNWLPLTFDLNQELPAFMGEFLKRQETGQDNHWILKPINMSRGMDSCVTNNLDCVIRMMETGPKVCQKYLENPLLLNHKKFDLRYIVLLKSVFPLKVFVYNRFWVRSANNNYSLVHSQQDDYETHFTVMNYSGRDMQHIQDTEFMEVFEKECGTQWSETQAKIYQTIKEMFSIAAQQYPKMQNPKSRAIYGIDIILDENKLPHVLEVNFCPDCKRAVDYYPNFTNEVFSCLFFDETLNVTEL